MKNSNNNRKARFKVDILDHSIIIIFLMLSKIYSISWLGTIAMIYLWAVIPLSVVILGIMTLFTGIAARNQANITTSLVDDIGKLANEINTVTWKQILKIGLHLFKEAILITTIIYTGRYTQGGVLCALIIIREISARKTKKNCDRIGKTIKQQMEPKADGQ